ncbi:MAG: hypothetical protein VKK04_22230 [Synechococcales bacterium]|nr:hypothetical protein [Synechococcales bacterium]
MTLDTSSQKPQPAPTIQFLRFLTKLTFVGILGSGVFQAVSVMNIQSRFQKGEDAYNALDCATAVSYYDKVIAADDSGPLAMRSHVRKSECAILDSIFAAQVEEDVPTSLAQAQDYLEAYPVNIHADFIREQSVAQAAQQSPEALAVPEVCDRLGGMIANQLLPQTPDLIPALGYACGQQYMANSNYGQAIASYQLVQSHYPDHELMPTIEASLADATVQQAKASGAGTIPQPGRSGSAPAGSTVVVIHNASPEPVRIAFSGVESRIETLEPCIDCQVYIDTAPEGCPNSGPVGVYTLSPGTYDVVVSSSDDFTVMPFVGQWDLRSGSEYSNCFFTVQTSTAS